MDELRLEPGRTYSVTATDGVSRRLAFWLTVPISRLDGGSEPIFHEWFNDPVSGEEVQIFRHRIMSAIVDSP